MQENPILITRILWSVSFQFFVGKIAIKKTNIPTTGWWFGTFLFFHILGMNVIITTDELMFFRGVAQPPTSKLILDITMLYNHQQGFRLHGSNDENGLKNMEIL
jgi:hypothetical protein